MDVRVPISPGAKIGLRRRNYFAEAIRRPRSHGAFFMGCYSAIIFYHSRISLSVIPAILQSFPRTRESRRDAVMYRRLALGFGSRRSHTRVRSRLLAETRLAAASLAIAALGYVLKRSCTGAVSIGEKDVREITEEAYPGAKITEIEKEKYQCKKIYEVDIKHDGKNLEAIISLDGEIIKVGVDDQDC
jgi:hypothetical protein